MFCSHLSFINLSLSLPPSFSLSLSLSFSLSLNFFPKSQTLIDQPCSCSNYLPSSASLFSLHSLSNPPFVLPFLCLCIPLSAREEYFFPPLTISPSPVPVCVSLSSALFALCLLVSAEKKYSVFSLCQSRRAASSQMLLSSTALHAFALLPPSVSLSLLISCSVASRVVCSSVTRGYHLPF